MGEILIVGGGISGLTLGLSLHEIGAHCRIYEAAPEFHHLGVGLNLHPHGVRELTKLGLQNRLTNVGVETSEMNYYSRFGEFIFSEPRGRYAGYSWPQFSIHRGDFHQILVDAVCERLGPDAIVMNHRCSSFEQSDNGIIVHFADAKGALQPSARGDVAIACDGLHSAVRKRLFPNEGPPVYHGVNMWRGLSRWKPFLSGTTMVQAGWIDVGKMVIYPISKTPDSHGMMLINWVAELQTQRDMLADWNLAGRIEDIYPTFANWHFGWLDVAEMIRNPTTILEYPMVDRDPLPHWTVGRVTLVGDAAHPMYPRGGNGANQSILDARALAHCVETESDLPRALKAYEAERLSAANGVVLQNRTAPPDAILRVVHEKSGDRPFGNIDDLIGREELAAITDRYKRVAGFDKATMQAKG